MGKLSESGALIKAAMQADIDANFVNNTMLAYLENPPVAINGEDGIPGVAGADGAAGLAGTDGSNGTAGEDGTNGTNGADGALGLTGADGQDGTNGAQGPQGDTGAQGIQGIPGTGSGSSIVQPLFIDLANPTYGYVADYVNGTTVGTDNKTAINAAISAAIALRDSSGQKVCVHFPAGKAYVTDYIHFPQGLEISASSQSKLYFQISDGVYGTPLITQGHADTLQEGMTFSFPHIEQINWWNNHKFRADSTFLEGFCGIRILNTHRSNYTIRGIQGCAIGLQLRGTGLPSTPLIAGLVAYNSFQFMGRISTNLINIDLYAEAGAGTEMDGWVNENRMYGANIQSTSNMKKYGSVYGVRFKGEPGGYRSQNNNRFFGFSFEMGLSRTDWAASTAFNTPNTRVKSSNEMEYLALGTGTSGTTEPTHLSGDVSDGSITWRHIGKYRKSPVLHDGAGSLNKFYGCRWESGYGAFAVYKDEAAYGNSYEIYTAADPDTGSIPGLQRYIEDYDNPDVTTQGGYKLSNRITVYSDVFSREDMQFNMDNLHYRAVGSAAGMTVAGMAHAYIYGSQTDEWPPTPVADTLCIDGVIFKGETNGGGTLRGVWVDVSKIKRFIAEVATPETGRWYLRGYDENFEFVNSLDSNLWLRAEGGMIGYSTNKGMIRSPANINHPCIATASDDSPIKYIFVAFHGAKITSLNIKMLPDNLSAKGNCEVLIPHGDSEDQRKCYGTPTLGIFQKPGEFIQNLNTSTEQVFGWRVKTKGYLSPQFVASETKIKGQLSSNLGRHYYAVSPGVQTSTLPTHTSGTTNGLTYVGVNAVFIASLETY